MLPDAEVGVDEAVFVLDGGEGLEEKLGDIGERGRLAERDAVADEEGEEFSQDMVEVGGGLEAAGQGGELGGDKARGEALFLLGGVVKAEGGVGMVAGKAAFAAGLVLELAEGGFRGSGAVHGSSP